MHYASRFTFHASRFTPLRFTFHVSLWYNVPMLIGVDASRIARAQRTGTEAYSLHLIRALIKTGCEHRFRLYTPVPLSPDVMQAVGQAAPGGGPANSLYEGRVIPFPRLWTHLRLAWEVSRHPPDVLLVPAHVMPLVCPVPAVVTVHDLGYLHYPEAHRRFDRWYLDWTTRRHARLAACVIADSRATRADLIRHYQADPDRIVVVYPGRDASLSRVDDREAIAVVKRRYSIGGDYLLYLGTLQPRKNLVRLVEAFARLQPLTPDLRLVLAGKKGWLYDDLFARVEALGVEDRVVFTGYVADADKALLLSGALALVYPSLYEGFGLPVLEAMACGTPVLTSNVSSLPEVAGAAALLVDPLDVDAIAEAMSCLISDTDLRNTLAEEGYEQIQSFSWAKAAREVLQVLESVASKR
jgi:glycosyltransferase involved in cell wall biosynthesis